ncbi:MAG: riboflavin synthase, partial [Actinomycetota bacterium]
MFTGIVEAMGRVVAKGSHSIELACPLEGLRAGDSLLVNGVCLTISRTDVGWCAADLSEETLSRSSLGLLEEGDVVNLERPVEAGGRLGGHIVQGHVD